MDSTTNDPNQFSTYDLSYLSNTTADSGNVVYLLVYDLSHGMAKHFSLIFLGKQIDAIYHTSIVYFGVEYFFGQDGICAMPYSDGCNNMGRPISKICLGYSEIPLVLFQEYISTLNSSTFGVGTYDLFKHNCNNFSNEVAQFLTGVGIPEEIINLPSEVLSTNFGQILSRYQRPLENQINQSVTSVNNPADWRTRTCQTLRETLRKTRKRQKKRRNQQIQIYPMIEWKLNPNGKLQSTVTLLSSMLMSTASQQSRRYWNLLEMH
uniref:PPPDE domain-containing protein n=1 Tax=Tetranychus urticae TaxID=32264 RepID=T1L2U7_TETUR